MAADIEQYIAGGGAATGLTAHTDPGLSFDRIGRWPRVFAFFVGGLTC